MAGPFCATVLGEFGAEVIKVERPGTGDNLRRFGTETDCGDTLVWLSEGRNKRSVTINLADPRGRELVRYLAATADVVIENLRPGVLERWGLVYGPKEQRLAARPLVNALVAQWVASQGRDEVLAACRAAEVPAGPVHSIAEIFEDPQYLHRETIVTADPRIGPLAVPGTLPALSDTPGGIRWLGPALGADTNHLLTSLLHRRAEEIAALRAEGVV